MITANIMRLVRIYNAKLDEHFGKLYIVSSDQSAYEETCNKFFNPASQEERVGAINPVLVKDFSEFNDDSLADAVMETGANLVGAVLDAEQGAPAFLMMRSSGSTVFNEADIFAFKIDKMNRDALSSMMENMAVNAPEACRAFLKSVDIQRTSLKVSRGGRPKAADKAEEIRQFKERYVDNMRVIHDPSSSAEDVARAENEVQAVFASLSPAALSRFMYLVLKEQRIPDDKTIKEDFLDLNTASEKSDGTMEVRPRKKGEKIINSDGKYRLTFKKGENAPILIKFPGTVETALYISLLMDRHFKGTEKLELSALEDYFIGVYRAVYVCDYPEAKAKFEEILYHVNPDGSYSQGRSRNYLPNMRKAISEALLGVDNPAIYHYKQGDRLHIQKDRIKFPESFVDEVERLKDPRQQATFV